MTILPSDMVNRSLDAIGAGTVIGDLSDGSKISEAARRNYGPTLRGLLRAVHWNFNRKRAELQLLADASGQTLAPNGQAISNAVEPPWTYAYGWPNDCLKPRWVPWAPPGGSPVDASGVALTTGTVQAPYYPQMPARFLISSSDQFNDTVGQTGWDNAPDLHGTEGAGLLARRIILSDVPGAECVYSALVVEIEQWDPLFGQAFVSALGERLCLVAIPDRKIAMAERAAQVSLAKRALIEARIANGNEAGFPQTTDHTPDWIRARSDGGFGAGSISLGPGYTWLGADGYAFSDGSVF